ncbi:signal transduction histidine kinase [Kribbella orskensis]|uniref:histidine kinase n=1 Tax=Kribbella orskensis TaxID=2512216 RepID=A0ABY2BHP6_9ACTN|nr:MULTISPECIES: sensor histidine kinase [Kribbella]TCN38240.1 signal transduction histidine kinase [Kribbella sp. VKM Ac-2500]TCO20230.1 signal transduction histidine kinase [Kribbella orskensis]
MTMAQAAPRPPMRFPRLAQPFIALGLAILAELGIAFFVLNVVAVPLIAVWVGIPMLLVFVPCTRWFANCHRTLLASFTGTPIQRPYKKPPMPGVLMWLRTTLSDPATWRDIAWLLVNAVIGFTLTLLSAVLFLASVFYLIYPFLVWVTPDGVFDEPFGGLFTLNVATAFLMVPFGLLAFLIWTGAGERLLKADAYLAQSLLGPTENAKLAIRVRELAESRAETVDTQAAELRRIERDLHDGAQARLAALSMNLGMAEEMVNRDPAQAAALLTEARESASTALSELRDLVRGIHPPVLADRGLEGAVKALAMSLPFKVDVTIDLPGRPPAPVESAAYFAVAEALANVLKHAAATTAWVQLSHEKERLHILVGDDGVGGATVRPGGGLYGIERRLAAFDGTLTVASPTGGPTTVIMELPCESSSLKITPSSGTA